MKKSMRPPTFSFQDCFGYLGSLVFGLRGKSYSLSPSNQKLWAFLIWPLLS